MTKFRYCGDMLMDPRFSFHNTHLGDVASFKVLDPQLRQLSKQYYVNHSALLDQLPVDEPGVYTLGGGRQIGKTTLLKQWMLKLLEEKVEPSRIAFFSGELIDDQHALLNVLQTQLNNMPKDSLLYIIVDEVTYIKDWDKAVKYAVDAGLLENVELILTGSDLLLIKEALTRFPGRRGKSSHVNFHLYPLSFRETVTLKQQKKGDLNTLIEQDDVAGIELLFQEFQFYLIHGGYLTAINDMAKHGKILTSTLMTYSDWIRGDILKRGKQEHYLREILTAIIKRYCSQITWNSIAQDLSIDHPKTVADYIALLELIDAVFVQAALIEDKLVGAPKKARKLMFADPFIFHALNAWIYPDADPFENQIKKKLNDPILNAQLVEATAITHYRRYYPTYYIKAEGEVDIAYINRNRFWPIEIKWANQIRPKDLKQIAKYSNAKILTKFLKKGLIHDIPTEPLPLSLWNLG